MAFARPVAAHALDVGTARVTLRDEHLEVTCEWDLLTLTQATPTAIAIASEVELSAMHGELRARVEAQTRLSVDGEGCRLVATGFPSFSELRALAAVASASGDGHGALARIRLECARPVHDAREVALSVPPALGAVLVSFVQPAARYAQSGESAAFTVLTPVAQSARGAPVSDSPGMPWRALIGALAGATAGYVLCLLRFRSRSLL